MRSLLVLAAFLASTASGQTARFDEPTDTILLSAPTALGTIATFEAVVLFPSEGGLGGMVYNEWSFAAEDKQFPVYFSPSGPSTLVGYAFPRSGGAFLAEAKVSADTWHHVAYVIDTAEERLYLDGVLVASRAVSGAVGNGSNPGRIGAISRGGTVIDAFRGYVDALRISAVARYTGASFTPTIGDLPNDENTVLLLNFNELAGSPTVQDESPNSRTGTLGVGFETATSPTLGTIPVTSEPAPDGTFALGVAPNPIQHNAQVRFALAEAEPVELAVLDLLGRRVASVLDGGVYPAGAHAVSLDASSWAPGVYVVRLVAGGEVQTQRLTVVR